MYVKEKWLKIILERICVKLGRKWKLVKEHKTGNEKIENKGIQYNLWYCRKKNEKHAFEKTEIYKREKGQKIKMKE